MSTEQTLNSENDRLEPMKLLNIQNKIKVNSDLESLMATAILKVKLHQKTDTLVLDLAENCNVKEAKATQNGNEIPLDANHKEGKLYLLSKLPLDGNLDINIL